MKSLLSKDVFKGDYVVWIILLTLMFFSLVMVFTSTSNMAFVSEARTGNFFKPFSKHLLHVTMAATVCFVGARIHPTIFSKCSVVLLIISVILLFLVQVMGRTINDGTRWLSIGGFSFQPSELARLALINYTAFMLRGRDHASSSKFFMILFAAGVVILPILKENFSTALLLTTVIFLMCVIGGANTRMLWTTAAIGVVGAALLVCILLLLPSSPLTSVGRLGTVKSRIEKFVNKTDEHKSSGNEGKIADSEYQIVMARKAIANGGYIGVGAGKSEMRFFLPQAFSDFIYAVICEEYGIVGGVVVLLLYFVLFFRVSYFTKRAGRSYYKLLGMGIGIAILMQALLHMSVSVGIGPVTGQTLPFISRGGTSYVITALYFAILLSVSEEVKRSLKRQEAMATGGNGMPEVVAESIPEIQESYMEGDDRIE